MNNLKIDEWRNIPENAFLYFPRGQEIIVGNQEKQWRKIFEGEQIYNTFETQALDKLQRRLQEQKVTIDPWFDRPNKLRFLQANKFKTSKTIQSMTETTKWRSTSFPIKMDNQTSQLLNSGAFYFCGRDDKYRPILVADIGRFDPESEENDSIQKSLVVIMQFMINELLIEGQVQNYVLIMNLEKATFGLRGIIMKILSFTSNAYRGRLFVSYILSMPTLIRWGWDAIISKFVSENTLKKLKITGDGFHEDMWNHISKKTIEVQYRGEMGNLQGPFWPPNVNHLLFVDPQRDVQNTLISVQQYDEMFKQGKLPSRKILRKFVSYEALAIGEHEGAAGANSRIRWSRNQLQQRQKQLEGSVIPIRDYSHVKERQWKAELVIKKQTAFKVDCKTIETFFQSSSFKRVCTVHTI